MFVETFVPQFTLLLQREHVQTSERADEMETELSKCKTRNREMEVELDTAVREKVNVMLILLYNWVNVHLYVATDFGYK